MSGIDDFRVGFGQEVRDLQGIVSVEHTVGGAGQLATFARDHSPVDSLTDAEILSRRCALRRSPEIARLHFGVGQLQVGACLRFASRSLCPQRGERSVVGKNGIKQRLSRRGGGRLRLHRLREEKAEGDEKEKMLRSFHEKKEGLRAAWCGSNGGDRWSG